MDKKNKIYIVLVFIVLLFIFPILINGFVSSGIFGWKPIVTEFKNKQWFEFWYNYIPAIIAFTGTLIAINIGIKQNSDLMTFEEKNFSYNLMPNLTLDYSVFSLENLIDSSGVLNTLNSYRESYLCSKRELNELINNLMLESEHNIQNQVRMKILKNILTFTEKKEVIDFSYFEGTVLNKLSDHFDRKVCSEIINLVGIHNSNMKTYLKWSDIHRTYLKESELILQNNVNEIKIVLINDFEKDFDKLYCMKFYVEMVNFSNSDIISFFLINVELYSINSITYNVDRYLDIIIRQANKEIHGVTTPKTKLYFEITENDNKIFDNTSFRIKFSFRIKTAAGYEYEGENYSIIEKNKTTKSISSLRPILKKSIG